MSQPSKLLQIKARVTSVKFKDALIEIELPETDGRFPSSTVNAKITVDGKPLDYVKKVVIVLDADKKIPTLTISKWF